ncbi:MAG: phosphate ABC transporter permease family protein, partial [Pseudomonadota bacterium]
MDQVSIEVVPAILLLVSVLAIAGFVLGANRAVAAAGGDRRTLHSLPKQHGWHVALATFVPAVVFLLVWGFLSGFFSNIYLTNIIADDQPEVRIPLDQRAGLTEREIEVRETNRRIQFAAQVQTLAVAIDGYVANGNVTEDEVADWNADFAPLQERLRADGQVVGAVVTPGMLGLAQDLRVFNRTLNTIGPIVAVVLAVAGFALSLMVITRDFRARIATERWLMG